jgi:Concanavalin A-like lectin/glucanases superfamily
MTAIITDLTLPSGVTVSGKAITGSISFNGSSQYLSVPSSSVFAFSGDFTVEGWIYLTAYPSGAAAAYLTDFRNGSSSNFVFGIYSQNTYTYQGGTQLIGSSTVTLNAWHHWAVVRSGSTVTTYLDGTSQGTISSSFSQTSTSTIIGARYTGTQEYFTGYISNLRIVNGVAVYTSNFTAPTGPLSIIQSSNQNGSPSTAINLITSTSLMLNTVNNSDYLTDSSSYKNTVTAVASPTSSQINPFN